MTFKTGSKIHPIFELARQKAWCLQACSVQNNLDSP